MEGRRTPSDNYRRSSLRLCLIDENISHKSVSTVPFLLEQVKQCFESNGNRAIVLS